jgi:hypothetical protein
VSSVRRVVKLALEKMLLKCGIIPECIDTGFVTNEMNTRFPFQQSLCRLLFDWLRKLSAQTCAQFNFFHCDHGPRQQTNIRCKGQV